MIIVVQLGRLGLHYTRQPQTNIGFGLQIVSSRSSILCEPGELQTSPPPPIGSGGEKSVVYQRQD